MNDLLSRMSGFDDLASGETHGPAPTLSPPKLNEVKMPEIKVAEAPSYSQMLAQMQAPVTSGGQHAESDPSAALFLTGE